MWELLKWLVMLAAVLYFADWWLIAISVIISIILYISAVALVKHNQARLKAEKEAQQSAETQEPATTPFITYDDTCPDDSEDYGPEGSVIWGPRTIEENICINGKWYINENSEEWEENEE